MRLTVLLTIFLNLNQIYCNDVRFRVIRQWKYVNFTWPSYENYKQAILNTEYIRENNIIAGIKYFENNYYITIPRMKNGVPATLTTIPAGETNQKSPLFQPYPSWMENKLGDCSALQNVQNVEIDNKGLLWIIDGGKTATFNPSPNRNCPPKMVVRDLRMNRTVITYIFPDEVANFNSYLYDIVVDDSNDGFAYITDNGARDPGIIVYSIKDNRSWKIRHPDTMQADPQVPWFQVGGINITARLNLASIALGPKLKRFENENVILSDVREVFYCPISSFNLYSINTSLLRNENMSNTIGENDIKNYGRKESQTVGMIMDNKGNLYFSLLTKKKIAKWNISTNFQTGQRIIASDEKYLEWPNSYTFTEDGNLTVLVNQLDRFIYGSFNMNEYNFWLLENHVGGKSYIYDDEYKYNVNETELTSQSSVPFTTQSTPSSTTLKTSTSYYRVAHSSSTMLNLNLHLLCIIVLSCIKLL